MGVVQKQKEQDTVDPRNKLNELSAREWIGETVSVWVQRGLGSKHPDAQIEREHPAPFSFSDVSRLIRFFTKEGETVLDPFVGVGSTLKACALESRSGIGFELNTKYAELAKKRLELEVHDLFTDVSNQRIEVGDARELVLGLAEDSIEFVVTSPPYWNILHKQDHKANQERKKFNLDTKYSDCDLDLGNIENYEVFLSELSSILGACGRSLRPRRYMAVIVSDFRNKSHYVMFHADLVHKLECHSFELKGITILHQKYKRVFPYGYPFSFVPNIHHQYILILQNMK
jgi:DNA modification methylase